MSVRGAEHDLCARSLQTRTHPLEPQQAPANTRHQNGSTMKLTLGLRAPNGHTTYLSRPLGHEKAIQALSDIRDTYPDVRWDDSLSAIAHLNPTDDGNAWGRYTASETTVNTLLRTGWALDAPNSNSTPSHAATPLPMNFAIAPTRNPNAHLALAA